MKNILRELLRSSTGFHPLSSEIEYSYKKQGAASFRHNRTKNKKQRYRVLTRCLCLILCVFAKARLKTYGFPIFIRVFCSTADCSLDVFLYTYRSHSTLSALNQASPILPPEKANGRRDFDAVLRGVSDGVVTYSERALLQKCAKHLSPIILYRIFCRTAQVYNPYPCRPCPKG